MADIVEDDDGLERVACEREKEWYTECYTHQSECHIEIHIT